MSDYQKVTIKHVRGNEITIEVVENSSSRALSSIFDTGADRGIDGANEASTEDWLKIGAMLLIDEKARNGDVSPVDEDAIEPNQFVSRVEKVEATVLGRGDSRNPYYRAVLVVELKEPEHAAVFEEGQSFGAVADLGGDFDNLFD